MHKYLHIRCSDNDFTSDFSVFDSIHLVFKWKDYKYFSEDDLENIKPFIIGIWNSIYNMHSLMRNNDENEWWITNYPDESKERCKDFTPDDISDYLNNLIELEIVSEDKIRPDNWEDIYIPLFEGGEVIVC